MNLSTPYLMYILGAYGLSLAGLLLFLWVTVFQWKRSNKFSNYSAYSPDVSSSD